MWMSLAANYKASICKKWWCLRNQKSAKRLETGYVMHSYSDALDSSECCGLLGFGEADQRWIKLQRLRKKHWIDSASRVTRCASLDHCTSRALESLKSSGAAAVRHMSGCFCFCQVSLMPVALKYRNIRPVRRQYLHIIKGFSGH